jgi:diaminopimelate decarboxylase
MRGDGLKNSGGAMQRLKKILFPILKYLIDKYEKKGPQALSFSLWGLNISEKGHLIIGGCDSVELVEKYGAPIFVVDKERLINNYKEFYNSFRAHGIDFGIFYSYKTNPVPGVLKVLHGWGAGAEVISPFELWLALRLGVDPEMIIYNGPNKSDEGLRLAVEKNIKLININSFNEIDKIEDIAKELGVRPRVGVRVSTSGGWGNQFGLSIQSGDAYKAFERLSRTSSLQVDGCIHVHLGSGIKRTSIYEAAIENVSNLMQLIKKELGISIRYLDLGGGFGLPTVRSVNGIEMRLHHDFFKPYLPPNTQTAPSVELFIQRIVAKVKEKCAACKLELPVIIVEPGRAITGNTQILLSRIGDLKTGKSGYQIALTDAGINLTHPMSWEYHEIFAANKMNDEYNQFYGIAGPICTPTDLFVKNKQLPSLEVGDILSIMDAGAYFTSFSTNFSFPKPAVLMVAEGKSWIVRQKESYENMTQLDNL